MKTRLRNLGWRCGEGGSALHGQGGFTLVELLVFMAIMLIFMAAIGNMITSGIKSSSANYSLIKIEEGANEAMSTMVRQIRVASSLSPYCSATNVGMVGDVNGDGVYGDPRYEAVRFDAQNGYLRRGSAPYGAGELTMENWVEGCDSVTFTFWYYDTVTKQLVSIDMGNPASWSAHRLSVRRIDIQLQMSRGTVAGIDLRRTFTTSVNLRNKLIEAY